MSNPACGSDSSPIFMSSIIVVAMARASDFHLQQYMQRMLMYVTDEERGKGGLFCKESANFLRFVVLE